MKIVDAFQRKFGSRWTGVKFFFDDPHRVGRYFPKETRFCEAISQSWSSNDLLTRGCINCMGANYVFGWGKNIRDKVIENFHRKRNISIKDAGGQRRYLIRIPPGVMNGTRLRIPLEEDTIYFDVNLLP